MAKKGERQKIDSQPIAGMTFGAGKAKGSGSYPVASYRIAPDVKQAVEDLAKDLGVSPAELVEVLLVFGLTAYQDGQLELTPKVKKYSLR